MVKDTTCSALFMHYSLPPETKIPQTSISFRVKTTYIENQYDIYSRTCEDGSSMLEGAVFTFSYEKVAGIISLCIIIFIVSAENLIIFP